MCSHKQVTFVCFAVFVRSSQVKWTVIVTAGTRLEVQVAVGQGPPVPNAPGYQLVTLIVPRIRRRYL